MPGAGGSGFRGDPSGVAFPCFRAVNLLEAIPMIFVIHYQDPYSNFSSRRAVEMDSF